jgi:hypothetical protein
LLSVAHQSWGYQPAQTDEVKGTVAQDYYQLTIKGEDFNLLIQVRLKGLYHKSSSAFWKANPRAGHQSGPF